MVKAASGKVGQANQVNKLAMSRSAKPRSSRQDQPGKPSWLRAVAKAAANAKAARTQARCLRISSWRDRPQINKPDAPSIKATVGLPLAAMIGRLNKVARRACVGRVWAAARL
jgi:hypothetical protein